MTTGCVILAGGKSSRMGHDKALLPIDNENFIKRLSEKFSFFEEKIIARGNRDDIADITWPVVPDIYPDHGPIGGLHAALKNCRSEALFSVACDTPLIHVDVFWKLQEKMRDDVDADILVTEDGKYHPLCGIYKKQIADVMEEQILNDNNRIRHVLNKICVEYVELNSFEYGIYNINTPEDYVRYIK